MTEVDGRGVVGLDGGVGWIQDDARPGGIKLRGDPETVGGSRFYDVVHVIPVDVSLRREPIHSAAIVGD